MNLKFRKAKPEDISGIIKVELGSGYHNQDFDAAQMIQKLFDDKKEKIIIAEVDNKIVGYRAFSKEGKIAEGGYLMVIKEFQGKGIGLELLKKSIADAKKLGCKKMMIYVRNDNLAAISLYNKLGFSVIEVIKQRDRIKLKMEKSLR